MIGISTNPPCIPLCNFSKAGITQFGEYIDRYSKGYGAPGWKTDCIKRLHYQRDNR